MQQADSRSDASPARAKKPLKARVRPASVFFSFNQANRLCVYFFNILQLKFSTILKLMSWVLLLRDPVDACELWLSRCCTFGKQCVKAWLFLLNWNISYYRTWRPDENNYYTTYLICQASFIMWQIVYHIDTRPFISGRVARHLIVLKTRDEKHKKLEWKIELMTSAPAILFLSPC